MASPMRIHIAPTGVRPRIARRWTATWEDEHGGMHEGAWHWKIVNTDQMSLGECIEHQFHLECWVRDRERNAWFDNVYAQNRNLYRDIFLKITKGMYD